MLPCAATAAGTWRRVKSACSPTTTLPFSSALQRIWVEAWRVEAGDCDVKAYGLLFKRACEDPD